MPIETTLSPRQLAAMKATRGRIRKARERRFAGYVAEMQRAGYAVTVIDPDDGSIKVFSTDPR